MAVCRDCDREMTTATSCAVEYLFIRGERLRRQPLTRRSAGPARRCGDCGVALGGWHHLGCDLEDCPRCGRQLLSCGCGDLGDSERCLHPLRDAAAE